MFDNNENLFCGNGLDFGSDTGAGLDGFTAFNDPNIDKIFGDAAQPAGEAGGITKDETVSEGGTVPGGETVVQGGTEVAGTEGKGNEKVAEQPQNNANAGVQSEATEESAEVPNFFASAIAKAEEKQAESTKSNLADKLPIFSYGSAKEEIVDTSKTFDAFRVEKAEDFPELDDASAVSWKMTYGTISKSVSTPKKTTIASLKKQIEESMEFTTMLKKSKGDVECKVTPSVVAKKKGTQAAYKGAFLSVDEAQKSNKVIAFVPSDDGRVYEMRRNKIGTFIAHADNVTILDKVRAGFIPALPKIPYKLLSEVISFFRAQISSENEFEALVYVYWSVEKECYYVCVPEQFVSKTRVKATVPDLDEDQFVLVMEIHSHNTMPALFSPIDDEDEKATRLYAVIGSLNKLYPDIEIRFSVGGRFEDVNADAVFEYAPSEYPMCWNNSLLKGAKV